MPDRSQEMIRMLEQRKDLGFALWQGEVVTVAPGSPVSLSPTAFTKADLDTAVRNGLLEKRSCVKLRGLEIEVYAAKQR